QACRGGRSGCPDRAWRRPTMKSDRAGSGFSSANRRRNNGRDPRKGRQTYPSTRRRNWGCRAMPVQKTAVWMAFEHWPAMESKPKATAGTPRICAYLPWTEVVGRSHGPPMILDSFPQYQALGVRTSRIARQSCARRLRIMLALPVESCFLDPTWRCKVLDWREFVCDC